MRENEFTPTQTKILNLLADGKPHTKNEVRMTIGDEFTSDATLRMHISNIRIRLKNRCEDIVCRIDQRRAYYQHVRLISSRE